VPSHASAAPDRPARPALRPLFLTFAAGYFLSYFLRSSNAVLAPALQAEIGLTPADLGFMTGALFGAYAAAQFPVGLALDRWGPRWVSGSLMAVGALGCVLFATGTSFLGLTVARVLLGVGLGSVLLAGLKAFSVWWPPSQFATVAGIYFATGSLGALAAATPLALLEAAIGWRTVFWLASGVVVAAGILLVTRIPNAPARVQVGTAPLDRGALGDVARIMVLAACMTGPPLAFQTLWAGPLLFDVYGYDAVRTGNLLLVMSLGITAGYGLSGALSDRFGLFAVTTAGTLTFMAAQVLLALHVEALLPFTFALFGVAGGHCVLGLPNARRLLGAARSGGATGAVNAAAILGVFLLQWAIGIVVGAVPERADAYRYALLATAAMTLVGWLVYLPAGLRVRAMIAPSRDGAASR
jgi:MFS family permease